MMKKNYDMIVIGGGPAGYSAALYTARAGLSTLVIERLYAGGQMTETTQIDNYPGIPQGISGFSLGMQMQQGRDRTLQAEIERTSYRPDRYEHSNG